MDSLLPFISGKMFRDSLDPSLRLPQNQFVDLAMEGHDLNCGTLETVAEFKLQRLVLHMKGVIHAFTVLQTQ